MLNMAKFGIYKKLFIQLMIIKNFDFFLQANLRRSSSIEAKIRQATKEALRESNLVGKNCVCQKPGPETCRNCMRREISDRLQHAGFNCGICKSKWMSSKDTLSGD